MSMYISTVPLPPINDFFHLEHAKADIIGEPWQIRRENNIHFFPRGSLALLEAAKNVAREAEKPICFFPAYFCEGSLAPLRHAGARIIFYRVTCNLEPDWDDVRQRAETIHPDLFILVHSFGRVQDTTELLIFSKETGCVILEDAAHVLMPNEAVGSKETIVLFSPHKLLALPPISLLSVPNSLNDRLQSPYVTAWRKRDWIWMAKRLLQQGIATFGGIGIKAKSKSNGFKPQNRDTSPSLDHPSEISRLGGNLLLTQQQHILEVSRRRKSNFSFIARSLENVANFEIPAPFNKWSEDSTPYTFPFFVGEERVNAVFSSLWRKGIPALTWPDLPPEVMAKPEEYFEACRWRRNLLLLPVHQSLSSKQLKRIVAGVHIALQSAR